MVAMRAVKAILYYERIKGKGYVRSELEANDEIIKVIYGAIVSYPISFAKKIIFIESPKK